MIGKNTTQRKVTPRWLDRTLVGVAILLAVVVALACVPMLWGWYPVMGPSMEPTFPYLGGYFRFERLQDPKAELRVNDLVVVRGGTIDYAVKRVAMIDRARGIFVKGDNVDRSLDSSFGADKSDEWKQVYIPFDEIRGRVKDVWSFARSRRQGTRAGRARNEFEFRYATQRVGCYSLTVLPDRVLVLFPDARIEKAMGKYQARTGTFLRIERGGVPTLVDMQNMNVDYTRLDVLLATWYSAHPGVALTISVKRVPYGLVFVLPGGEKRMVKCLLPPTK